MRTRQPAGRPDSVTYAITSATRKLGRFREWLRNERNIAVWLFRETVNSFMRIDAMGLAKQVATRWPA